jgi:hypothetical protein
MARIAKAMERGSPSKVNGNSGQQSREADYSDKMAGSAQGRRMGPVEILPSFKAATGPHRFDGLRSTL